MIGAIAGGWMPPLPALDNRMALVSAEDLCQAAVGVAETPGIDGRVYAVSDGQNQTPVLIEAAIYAALGRKKSRWKSPRMLFFATAVGAETGARLGLYRGGLRLDSYLSLCLDYPLDCRCLQQETGFVPTQTFEQQLPGILERLNLVAGGASQ